MADFPADVATGRVHGTVLAWLVDSADPGTRPDVGPFAEATVQFVPSVKFVTHPSTGTILVPTPDPITISVAGEVDVTLIATDDPDLNPTGFTYTMTITVIGGDIPPMTFAVPSGSDRKLTELVAVEESPGVYVTQGPAGLSAYQIAVNNGFVGTEQEWLDSHVQTDGTITQIVGISQASYNALSPPDPNTLYVITA